MRFASGLFACALLACGLLICGVGCASPAKVDAPKGGVVSLSAADILRRCGQTYAELSTYQSRGYVRDARAGGAPRVAVEWDFVRPSRFRMRVGDNVTIVVGDGWWTYHLIKGELKKNRQFTRTPIETAAALGSRGVPFLVPALLMHGERAFENGRGRSVGAWKLETVAWLGERPCYVMSRPERVTNNEAVLRVWIDQDQFVVREWALVVHDPEGRDEKVLDCVEEQVGVNAVISPERFRVASPKQREKPSAGGKLRADIGE